MNETFKAPQSDNIAGIASDHAGYKLKSYLTGKLKESGWQVRDFGTYSDESVDYPDFGHRLGSAIDTGEIRFGIAICFSGNGINITLNRHKGVRAAICWNTELAVLAREHNNANVCTLPANFVSNEEAERIVKTFVSGIFADNGRHLRRINKINEGL